MRLVILALGGAAFVAGCDSSVQTFGKSYDECILKNARNGGDRASRDTATQICERRFTRNATASDREAFGIATNIIDNPGAVDFLQIGVEPRDPNIVLKEVRSDVTFYRTARGRDARDRADVIDVYTWDKLPVVWDDWMGTYSSHGTVTGGTPSTFWTAKTVPTRVLTLGSR